jgi:hypothetical protein
MSDWSKDLPKIKTPGDFIRWVEAASKHMNENPKDLEVELSTDKGWVKTQLSQIKEGQIFRFDDTWPNNERFFRATHDAEICQGHWSVEADPYVY